MNMHLTRTLAGALALGIGIVASAAGLATAAPGSPANTGAFTTWKAAQKAAGFKLVKPTSSAGLKRSGRILVGKCQVTGELSKRIVAVNYGNPTRADLALNQNNSGGPCGNVGEVRDLGRFKVHGVWAHLVGACGLPTLPSCRSRNIWLFLSWKIHRIYYVASSHDERRATIVRFARGLVPVT